MRNKEIIIIINAIPNSEAKIKMLEDQIHYFDALDMPILIVSGCKVPEHIVDKVEYVIVNTDNEVIGKDYSYKMHVAGLTDLAVDHEYIGNAYFAFYWKTVNSTITKNIKLGFQTARILGYDRAFYTEDDNIFKHGSFDYLTENMDAIRSGQYKMAGWKGGMGTMPMICTAFFFADINWFCENFTIPHMKDEWYDVETSRKYLFHKPYEVVFYYHFKDKEHLFYDSLQSYEQLCADNEDSAKMSFGSMNRRFSEKNLIETFFTVVPVPDDNWKKILIMLNKSKYLPQGEKDYKVDIHFDNQYIDRLTLPPNGYYHVQISDDIKEIKLEIDGYGTRIIDCDLKSVRNNGHVNFLT